MTTPGADELPDDEVSFWHERLADARPPFEYGKIVISPPGDVGVAALDECLDWRDELDAVTGGPESSDEMLDEVDACNEVPEEVVGRLLDHFGLRQTPTIGWYSLVERINVYGPAIEYDLDSGTFRWSLHDYFAGNVPGGWDHLIRMLTRLPMGSHYRAAIADDDQLAWRVLEAEGPRHKRKKGSGRPPLAGFDLTTSYLHRIENRLLYLAWAVFAAQAGKKRSSPPKGAKGPETADERVDLLDFMREHDEVVSQILVRKGGSAKRVSDQVLGPDGTPVERPIPQDAARKGVLLPRAFGLQDESGGDDG